MSTLYRPQIILAAHDQSLDPDLVEAVVLQESAGETRAYRYEPQFWVRYMAHDSRFGSLNPRRFSASYGLMQVMYVVAVEMGFDKGDPEYLLVPSIGLDLGCRKLRQLLTWAQGTVFQALAAYNGGKKANSRPPYRNAVYAKEVLARLDQIRTSRSQGVRA